MGKRFYKDGYVLFDTDMDSLLLGIQRQGVLAGYGNEVSFSCNGTDANVVVHEGMVVKPATDYLLDGTTFIYVPRQTLSFAQYQDASLPKKALIYIDTTNVTDYGGVAKAVFSTASLPYPSYETGRNTVFPKPPDYETAPLNSEHIPIAEIWLNASGSYISSGNITDRRIFIQPPLKTIKEGGKTSLFLLPAPIGYSENRFLYKQRNPADDINFIYFSPLMPDGYNYIFKPLALRKNVAGTMSVRFMLPKMAGLLDYNNLELTILPRDISLIKRLGLKIYGGTPFTSTPKYATCTIFTSNSSPAFDGRWNTISVHKKHFANGPYGMDWVYPTELEISLEADTVGSEVFIGDIRLVNYPAYDYFSAVFVGNGLISTLSSLANDGILPALSIAVNPAGLTNENISQLRTLYSLGWDILNGGNYGIVIDENTSAEEIYLEMIGGKIVLENLGFVRGADIFVYPNDTINKEAINLAGKYFKYALLGSDDVRRLETLPEGDRKVMRMINVDDTSLTDSASMSSYLAYINSATDRPWLILKAEAFYSSMITATTYAQNNDWTIKPLSDVWSIMHANYQVDINIPDVPRDTKVDIFANVLPTSTTYVHGAVAGAGPYNEVTVTTYITQTDYPRTILVTCTNNSSPSGNLRIVGYNCLGRLVTDSIALIPAGLAESQQAFARIIHYIIPNGVLSADSVALGIGNNFGLSSPFWHHSDIIRVDKGGTYMGSWSQNMVSAKYNTIKLTVSSGETWSVRYLTTKPAVARP